MMQTTDVPGTDIAGVSISESASFFRFRVGALDCVSLSQLSE
jgi:hypothetical protein